MRGAVAVFVLVLMMVMMVVLGGAMQVAGQDDAGVERGETATTTASRTDSCDDVVCASLNRKPCTTSDSSDAAVCGDCLDGFTPMIASSNLTAHLGCVEPGEEGHLPDERQPTRPINSNPSNDGNANDTIAKTSAIVAGTVSAALAIAVGGVLYRQCRAKRKRRRRRDGELSTALVPFSSDEDNSDAAAYRVMHHRSAWVDADDDDDDDDSSGGHGGQDEEEEEEEVIGFPHRQIELDGDTLAVEASV